MRTASSALGDERRVSVGVGEDRDGAMPMARQVRMMRQRDLAPVGDENLANGLHAVFLIR